MRDRETPLTAELFTAAAQSLYLRLEGLSKRLTARLLAFATRYREALITWAVLLVFAFCIFGYGWITHGFTLPLSGDGYLQEMTFPYTFYDMWHEFFRTGHFPQWDTTSALGTNNIGGNSFYSLFSIQQILMLPFPRHWIPYLLALRYVFDTTLAGFFFYLYLRSFGLKASSRRVGAVAFAFCGWVMYYLWFEHFLDSLVMFPLILWGIEQVIAKRDPRLLIGSLFLQGITNYFFMVIFCITTAFYALFRYFTEWKHMETAGNRLAVIGLGLGSYAIGVLSCAFILLPGIAQAMGLPRVEDASYLEQVLEAIKGENGKGFKDLVDLIFNFDRELQNGYPGAGFFFMTARCYSSNLLGVSWYDNSSGSSFVFTPIMLMAFSGLLEGFKRKKPSWIIGAILIAFTIFTPFFYYLFSAFTLPYARFLIAPSAWIIAFACCQIDRIREKPKWSLDGAFALLVSGQIIVSVYSYIIVVNNPSVYDQVADWEVRFQLVPLSLAISLIYYLILRFMMKSEKLFAHTSVFLVGVEAIIMGNLTMYNHGYGSLDAMVNVNGVNYGQEVVRNEQKIVSALEDFDPGYYRIQNGDASRDNPNLPMVIGHSGLSAFNSVYAVNAQDFLDWSHIPYTYQNWSMGEHARRVNMETFLGVKYYMVPRIDQNVPFGYVDVLDLDPQAIADESERAALVNLQDVIRKNYEGDSTWQVARSLYVNTDFVDFAFPFDSVLSSGSFYSGDYEDLNEYAYLRYGIVDEEQVPELEKAIEGTDITFRDLDEFYAAGQNFRSSDTLSVSLTPTSSDDVYEAELTYLRNQRTYDITLDCDRTDGGYTFTNERYGLTFDFPNGLGRGTFTGLNAHEITAILAEDAQGNLRIQTAAFYPIRIYNDSSDSDVTVYAAQWIDGRYVTDYDADGQPIFDGPSLGHSIFPADIEFDYDTASAADVTGLLYWTKLVIEPEDGSFFAPDATPEHPAYISVQSTKNFDWKFVDENDEEIPLDGLQSYSDYQTAHGFYVDRPVAKIVGVLHDTMEKNERIERPKVYVQSYGDYALAVDKLNAEPVEILDRTTDRVRFKTDYDEAKYTVLNQPFEDGWTLHEVSWDDGQMALSDVETFKAHGGFVGFVAQPGEHEYLLTYTAPGFELGLRASIIGMVLGGIFVTVASVKAKDRALMESRLASLAYGKAQVWRKD